ncbi:MAG: transglutaminase family protein [Chloroflexi bacterium]|nr:transglutaminase family protein [Chloroflexota bacterium]
MRLRLGCEFQYESASDVPMIVLVRPHPASLHNTLYEARWTNPSVPVHEYRDTQNNDCWRLIAPPGDFTLRYDALVEVSGEPDPIVTDAPLVRVQDLPDDTLVFTLASRYIQSDLLSQQAWDLFGQTPPTWQRVQAVCDWVHQNVRYQTGSSDPSVTAVDVYERGVGVCRDFALIAIAFCRALNIPARYTFGYLPDIAVEPPDVPMDFHAWFEAFLGGRWYAFDARHNTPRIGRVVIARGRDAVDVAMSTSYGAQRLQSMTVWAEEVTGALIDDNDADELEAVESRGA